MLQTEGVILLAVEAPMLAGPLLQLVLLPESSCPESAERSVSGKLPWPTRKLPPHEAPKHQQPLVALLHLERTSKAGCSGDHSIAGYQVLRTAQRAQRLQVANLDVLSSAQSSERLLIKVTANDLSVFFSVCVDIFTASST